MSTKAEKRIGIWMDHSTAHLIEFTTDPLETTSIESEFTHEQKEQSLNKSEHVMHNKEQHEQAGYYKKLGEAIRNYDEVILFGPTNAKVELHNVLKKDHLFSNIKIETQQADKMSEPQQHAFVKDYFTKRHFKF
jgi:nitrogenase subunit NifH